MATRGVFLPAEVLNAKDIDASLSAFFLKLHGTEMPYCANYKMENRFKELVKKVNPETYKLILHHYLRTVTRADRLLSIFENLKLTHEDAVAVTHNTKLFSEMIDVVVPLLSEQERAALIDRMDSELEEASRGLVGKTPGDNARKFMVNEAGAKAIEKYINHPCMHDVLLELPELDAQSGRKILRKINSSSSSATTRMFQRAPSLALAGLQCIITAKWHFAPNSDYINIPFHKTNRKFNMLMIKRMTREIQRKKELK